MRRAVRLLPRRCISSARTQELEQAYQNCSVAHTLGTTYAYDGYGNISLMSKQNLVDANGQPLNPGSNVYTLSQYSNNAATWRLGLLLYRKVSASSYSGTSPSSTKASIFRLTSWTYDKNANVLSQGRWDDGNGRFLTTVYTYDGFGNRLTTTMPSTAVYTTEFEPTYQSYPLTKTVTTAPGKSLTMVLRL